jgi:hypothetical protein
MRLCLKSSIAKILIIVLVLEIILIVDFDDSFLFLVIVLPLPKLPGHTCGLFAAHRLKIAALD